MESRLTMEDVKKVKDVLKANPIPSEGIPLQATDDGGIFARRRLTNALWEQMLDRAGHKCLKCEAKVYPLSQDHVMPLVEGGTNDVENIQPLCLKCNQIKGETTADYRPADWPWRVKMDVVVRVVLPTHQFLADIERVRAFMYEWRKRFPGKTFVSANDPHMRWIRDGSGGVAGECGACPGKAGSLTQGQVDKSVDNFVSEAHVAWHLAKGMMEMCVRLEAEAARLYLPEGKRDV